MSCVNHMRGMCKIDMDVAISLSSNAIEIGGGTLFFKIPPDCDGRSLT